jgi:hypothetical protein
MYVRHFCGQIKAARYARGGTRKTPNIGFFSRAKLGCPFAAKPRGRRKCFCESVDKSPD